MSAHKPRLVSYTLHGSRSRYSECDDRPVCTTCDTGMICDMQDATHFCGWRECTQYDALRMAAFRTMATAASARNRSK